MIREDSAVIYAWLRASLDGFGGEAPVAAPAVVILVMASSAFFMARLTSAISSFRLFSADSSFVASSFISSPHRQPSQGGREQ